MEDIISVLEKFGLSKTEAKLYLALLNFGDSTVNALVKKTATDRRLSYDSLEKLSKKGLVSWTEKNYKKYYAPVNPSRFLEITQEKKDEISRDEKLFRKTLPELESKFKSEKTNREIKVLEGLDGIKTVINNQITVGKMLHIIAGSGESFDYLKYFMPQFVKKRIKSNIAAKILYNEDARNKIVDTPLSEIRYIPKEHYAPMTISVYGDYVTFSIYSTDPLAVLIKSKEISQSFMNYFNLMWSISKK